MVQLKSLRLVSFAPERNGHKILAIFDLEYAGLELQNCALVKTNRGGFTTWPPRMGKRGDERGVRIVDSALFHEITAAARTAYRAMGGGEAEWTLTAARADVSAVVPECPVASQIVGEEKVF